MSRSCDDYLRQMGYREYSRYLSFHFPFTHERSLLEHLRACPWKWNQSHFKVCPQLSLLSTPWLLKVSVGGYHREGGPGALCWGLLQADAPLNARLSSTTVPAAT